MSNASKTGACSGEARVSRDREIWEARCRGETVKELAARYDLREEKVTQICVREQARGQRRADESGCTCGSSVTGRAVHEPPCPLSDAVELSIAGACPSEPRHTCNKYEGTPSYLACGACQSQYRDAQQASESRATCAHGVIIQRNAVCSECERQGVVEQCPNEATPAEATARVRAAVASREGIGLRDALLGLADSLEAHATKASPYEKIAVEMAPLYPKGDETADELRVRLIGALGEVTTLRQEAADHRTEPASPPVPKTEHEAAERWTTAWLARGGFVRDAGDVLDLVIEARAAVRAEERDDDEERDPVNGQLVSARVGQGRESASPDAGGWSEGYAIEDYVGELDALRKVAETAREYVAWTRLPIPKSPHDHSATGHRLWANLANTSDATVVRGTDGGPK